MRKILPKNLLTLATACPTPCYVVGGSVRDFLANLTPKNGQMDWDLASAMPIETFIPIAESHHFTVLAVYKNTGTLKLRDTDGNDYEYSTFRSDKYVRGVHTPVETFFTDDIALDARRRDFTANAVYYDIANDAFVDPLNGIPAIREKRLTTVAPAQKVFGEDGLRLMRLCRQSATLGFFPDAECLNGAKANASLIRDISPERIFTELTSLLLADQKYGVENGHYHGLKLLDETGVLQEILPELALGKGMSQRADFHKYDVLEHSLRTCSYAHPSVRLASLLHDVGKPFCTLRDGNSFAHSIEGERIVKEILTRLKASNRLIQETALLTKLHMYDFNCNTSNNKLRRFIVQNFAIIDKLLLVKQADFSACMDDTSPAPTCVRWRKLLEQMQKENAPKTLKELAVSGKDLLVLDIPPTRIATTLQALLLHAVVNPKDNEKTRLCKLAISFQRNLFSK